MGSNQCLNWIEEIFDKNPLGTTDEVASKEVVHKLRLLLGKFNDKDIKQHKVIDFVLEGNRISAKDKTELVRILLE